MKVEQFVVNINSQEPEKLISFYRDIVGLAVNSDFGPGAFMVGSSTFVAFIVEGHSEVKGTAKASEEVRLKDQGVEFVMNATGAWIRYHREGSP